MFPSDEDQDKHKTPFLPSSFPPLHKNKRKQTLWIRTPLVVLILLITQNFPIITIYYPPLPSPHSKHSLFIATFSRSTATICVCPNQNNIRPLPIVSFLVLKGFLDCLCGWSWENGKCSSCWDDGRKWGCCVLELLVSNQEQEEEEQ